MFHACRALVFKVLLGNKECSDSVYKLPTVCGKIREMTMLVGCIYKLKIDREKV